MHAAVPDEAQALGLGLVVEAVVAPAALGSGQEPLLFVVAYGHRLAARHAGKLAYLHLHAVPQVLEKKLPEGLDPIAAISPTLFLRP